MTYHYGGSSGTRRRATTQTTTTRTTTQPAAQQMVNQNVVPNTSQGVLRLPNILTFINDVPLFRTLQSALEYGQSVGLEGYHTHIFSNITGYMAGIDHNQAVRHKQNVVIKSFDIDLSNLPASGEERVFNIFGDKGSEFILEVKDATTGNYYNFKTKSFQNTKSKLESSIISNVYRGSITFPAVTGTDDTYDIFLYAKPGTAHAEYKEVRFLDDTIDINSSTGSNSLMMQKVIYQYDAITLTLKGYSPNSTLSGTFSTTTIDTDNNAARQSAAFSITATANAASAYKIIKQPTIQDLVSISSLTVGNDPEILPGENVFPAVTGTDTTGGAVTGGSSDVKVVMASAVANTMAVGDKITASTTTDTIDGAVSSGVKVVMDNNVAENMSIGDQITIVGDDANANHFLNRTVVTVHALNPDGDNVKEFSLSEAVELDDGLTLTFTPKCNRSETTVVALNPDGDNTSEFSMSQNVGLLEGATLSFSNRKNQRWSVDNINGLSLGDKILPGTNVTSDSFITNYENTIVINEGYENEETIVLDAIPGLDTNNQTPTIVKGEVTVQPGNIIFNKQQALAFGGDTINVIGYGLNKAFLNYGYDLRFTDLKIELTDVTTTTTSVVSNSTTVPVASVNGVLPGTTTVSGIGIDPSVEDPTINSRSVTSGAGNIELSAAQTLENGITLTYANAGQVATITGNIEIVSAGTSNQTLYFDLEKLLSTT